MLGARRWAARRETVGAMAKGDAGDKIVGGTIQKVVFASDQLPMQLDDRARFSRWRDQWNALYGAVDLARPDDRRFSVEFEFVPIGAVGLGRFQGTMNRSTRSRHHVAIDGTDNFSLGLQYGRSGVMTSQLGREAVLDVDKAVLLTNSEPGEVRAEAEIGWLAVNVSRRQLLQLVANAEDLIGAPLTPQSDALRHLRRYIGILLVPDGVGSDPQLIEHIGTTLVDLMALVIGAGRDAVEVARMRGLRAARLQEIVARIKAGFTDPALSPTRIGLELGLSARYIQALLHESGASFTERVMELRLQKAMAMLTRRQYDRLRVSEIAYACGFNEVSYFNQCFRRRFGDAPTHFRG
jgi:AraC-like DNA-binding protein